MIVPVETSAVQQVLRPECLRSGSLPMLPSCYQAKYLNRAWRPFEDLYFRLEEASRLFSPTGIKEAYRLDLLEYRESQERGVYRLIEISALDHHWIAEQFQLSAGVFWTEDGTVIINGFSDLVFLNISDDHCLRVFSQTLDELYQSSVTRFHGQEEELDANERQAFDEMKALWPEAFRNHSVRRNGC